ncbi:hypothetical protein TNCV_1327391 [Trichonephila clavipes]|nr:hypothetical protein TNCV_1327391 [Trichonephila clavipes]
MPSIGVLVAGIPLTAGRTRVIPGIFENVVFFRTSWHTLSYKIGTVISLCLWSRTRRRCVASSSPSVTEDSPCRAG